MNNDEMKNNVELLDRLEADLTAAREELEQINIEEKLLEFEQTAFPQVQVMFQTKDPYDKLWRTAYSFTQKHEKWLHGKLAVILWLSVILSEFCSLLSLR